MNFKPDDKVRCIKPDIFVNEEIIKNHIYTVKWTSMIWDYLMLEEKRFGYPKSFFELAYIKDFRNKLSTLTSSEALIEEWLKQHAEGLEEKIRSLQQTNPKNEIEEQIYGDNVVDIIKKEVFDAFNYLTPEELNSTITKEYIIMIIGNKILLPNK